MTRTSELLNELAAAKYLGLGVHQLRRWRSTNFGPSYLRLGTQRGVRYRVQDLEKFLRSRRVVPKTESDTKPLKSRR
jgi:hypothetical protein